MSTSMIGLDTAKATSHVHGTDKVAEAGMPEAARQALRVLHGQLSAVREAAAALEAPIVAHARQDETARRLATIPGVGPITASLVAATVVDIGLFKSARHLAAWLGLVPRQHSTGGKARLGRITKAGNEQIRMPSVRGATLMARRAGQWNSAAGAVHTSTAATKTPAARPWTTVERLPRRTPDLNRTEAARRGLKRPSPAHRTFRDPGHLGPGHLSPGHPPGRGHFEQGPRRHASVP